MKLKQLKTLLICSFLAISGPIAFSAESDLTESFPSSQISLLGGTYSLSSGKKTLSGIGSVLAQYQYYITQRMSASAGYQALFTDGSRSEVSGFDAGLNYCFLSCTPVTRTVGDLVSLKERGNFGITLGAGIAQRFFQLSNASLIYSGAYGKLGLSYFINDQFKLLTEVESALIKNRTVEFTENTFMFGLGIFLGSKNK